MCRYNQARPRSLAASFPHACTVAAMANQQPCSNTVTKGLASMQLFVFKQAIQKKRSREKFPNSLLDFLVKAKQRHVVAHVQAAPASRPSSIGVAGFEDALCSAQEHTEARVSASCNARVGRLAVSGPFGLSATPHVAFSSNKACTKLLQIMSGASRSTT